MPKHLGYAYMLAHCDYDGEPLRSKAHRLCLYVGTLWLLEREILVIAAIFVNWLGSRDTNVATGADNMTTSLEKVKVKMWEYG